MNLNFTQLLNLSSAWLTGGAGKRIAIAAIASALLWLGYYGATS